MAESNPKADHPHTDPGDGRTECEPCGKWVWPAIHSCKGVRVVDADKAKPGAATAAPGCKNTPSIAVDPPMFVVVRFCADGEYRRGPEVEYVRPTDTLAHAQEQLGHLRETATAGGRHCCRYEVFELHRLHPWQEYNAHGNTCHYPGCQLPEDQHAKEADHAR